MKEENHQAKLEPGGLGFVDTLVVGGKKYRYVSLPKMKAAGYPVDTLPHSLRIILESVVRNYDGKTIREEHIRSILGWGSGDGSPGEVPFRVARVVMHDLGLANLMDLAAMRGKVKELGYDPRVIQTAVPVDIVIDHSLQVDYYGTEYAFKLNLVKEFERSRERYEFIKWAEQAFPGIKVQPPAIGIIHEVNLEYLAKCVIVSPGGDLPMLYPDTLVGLDSHTPMINGLGVVGWGVGGIEGEAAMLGEPMTIAMPEVVYVNLRGHVAPGVTATDLVLALTKKFREIGVVGKFLEFGGESVSQLSVPDRATIANMCPEYGATMALFPVDEKVLDYLHLTGRSEESINLVKAYYSAQGMFGPASGVRYSETIDVDLSAIETTVAGPSLPQQSLPLSRVGSDFLERLGRSPMSVPLRGEPEDASRLADGDVVIAAIVSCTNTSNPQLMLGAGLLARNAVLKGATVPSRVKTSFAPGSRVVHDYLRESGLQDYLDKLGFNLVGYGCAACGGNGGPLPQSVDRAIVSNSLNVAAVLSANRNFESRVHRDVKSNYIMSPALVVAYAIAGTVSRDLTTEPLFVGTDGKPVYLRDIWPSDDEIHRMMKRHVKRETFLARYSKIDEFSDLWNRIRKTKGSLFRWDPKSTFALRPPFLEGFVPNSKAADRTFNQARPLLVLGDSVTTNHISPEEAIPPEGPAAEYLISKGVDPKDFGTFGSRRGNHEVKARGAFSNNRLKNALVDREGGWTKHFPSGEVMTIFAAAERYRASRTPLLVFAGKDYGAGSSRDWAAKGPKLLGVVAVVAVSFERIHRSNLVGMGILPLEFHEGTTFNSLGADPAREFGIELPSSLAPRSAAIVSYFDGAGVQRRTEVTVRLDTQTEVDYFESGGILPYVANRSIAN